MKNLKENCPLICGIFFFAFCFSMVVTMSPKMQTNYYEHSVKNGSIALNVHVGVKGRNENLSNIGFKLSRVVNGERQFAVVEEASEGYAITGWVDSESKATQIKTDDIGNVHFTNLTEGNYTVYESEITSKNITFVEPISIEVKRLLSGELTTAIKTKNVQTSKTNNSFSIALEHDNSDWTKELGPDGFGPGGICKSTAWIHKKVPGMKSGVQIIKEVYPPTEEDWEATLKVRAYYAYPNGALICLTEDACAVDENAKYYDMIRRVNLETLDAVEYKSYEFSSTKAADGTITLDNTVPLYDCSLEGDTGVMTVEIEEAENDQYRTLFSSNLTNVKQEGNKYVGQLNSLYGNQETIYVTNWDKDFGDLEVKEVTKEGVDPEKQFDLTVYLTPPEGSELADNYYYTMDGSDERNVIELGEADENGARPATFPLRNKEGIRIMGLPAGTEYEVVEDEDGEYRMSSNGDKGVVPHADVAKAELIHEKGAISVPNTFDNSNPVLWGATMVLAVVAIGVSCFFLKRKSH